jgi:DNA-3-methyladenine glycosylase
MLEQSSNAKKMLQLMQSLNPQKNSTKPRPLEKLCCGQALLCISLNLKIVQWDKKQFDRTKFYICSYGYKPKKIMQTTRLGIAKDKDEHLPYRFVAVNANFYCIKSL